MKGWWWGGGCVGGRCCCVVGAAGWRGCPRVRVGDLVVFVVGVNLVIKREHVSKVSVAIFGVGEWWHGIVGNCVGDCPSFFLWFCAYPFVSPRHDAGRLRIGR